MKPTTITHMQIADETLRQLELNGGYQIKGYSTLRTKSLLDRIIDWLRGR